MSRYLGRGDVAHAIAALEQADRSAQAVEREEEHERRAAEQAVVVALDQLAGQVQILVAATLLHAGYHQHHGTWRKRRGGTGET
jgi:hypothetical protein